MSTKNLTDHVDYMNSTDYSLISKKVAWAALICGVLCFIAGNAALYGNTVLFQASKLISESGVAAFDANAYHLAAVWWTISISYFAFTVFNTLFVLVFCGLVYLYGGGDYRLWAAAIIKVIWIAVALTVDTGLAASAWVNGLQNLDGLQPDQLVEVYSVIQERSYDTLRWPTRGFYLFAGVAHFIMARVGLERGWPKSLCYTILLLAITLWLEVLTFAITLIAGNSPIHLPAYFLNFAIATPLWGFMVWRHLRKNSIPTAS